MKKRNQRIHDYQTMAKKIFCGQFAKCLKNNFAVGDEDNNLILYNVLSPKPITVLNTGNSNNVVAVTSLTFTRSDDQIISGSSRGSINIWDLNTLKINSTLKGHTIEVSALAVDCSTESLLISGSADTTVKLWDLRTKNSISYVKVHRKKVNAITSTSSRVLLTAGEDGFFSGYDLKMMRPVFLHEVQSSVLCIQSNKSIGAIGCYNRFSRVYDIDSNKMIGTTKSQTQPITSIAFYDSQYMMTAGTDNLKVWDTKNELIMTDNIETSSKGILDMVVSDKIQQIAFNGGGLSYHQCFLSDVNFKGPYVFNNHSISHDKSEKVQQAIDKNNSIKRGNSNNPLIHISSEKTKSLIAKRNDSISKQLSDVTENINDALSNIKKASEEFSNRRNDSIQLKEMMGNQHLKFLKIMSDRAKSIQGMLDLWMKGNIKVLIQTLKSTDIYVVSDVLAQILKPSRATISAQFGIIIAERSKQMINSKHLSLIRSGLDFMLQVVTLFKDDMIKLKTFGSDKGVDLAREERLRKYDILIQQYVEIYQSHRLKKLVERKDQCTRLAEQLSNELTIIFKKVFGNDYQI